MRQPCITDGTSLIACEGTPAAMKSCCICCIVAWYHLMWRRLMACLLMGSCGERSRAIAREISKDLQSSLPPSPSCVAASRFVSRSSRLPSCRLLRSRVFAWTVSPSWTGSPSPSSLSLLSSSLACGEAASGGAPVVLEELEVPRAFGQVLEMALLNHQFLQCPQQCCKTRLTMLHN